jgi:surface polysaccharide O-acyltransferase-like enzyme
METIFYQGGRQMEKSYFYSLDFTKFFCAIAVILIHVTSPLVVNETATLINYYSYRYFLEIAVPFFFIISGFLLGQKYSLSSDPGIVVNYIKKIFTYYLLFSLFYLIFKYILMVLDSFYYGTSFKEVTLDFMRHISYKGFLNGSIGSFHLWYLASLIYACIILYVLLKMKATYKQIVIIGLFLFFFVSSKFIEIPRLFNHGGIVLGFYYLSIGFFLSQFKNLTRIKFPLFFMILSAFIFFVFSYYKLSTTGIFLGLWAFYLTVVCIRNPHVGKNSLILRLSKYTLPIYILHIFIRDLILKIIEYVGYTEFYMYPLYYILTTLLCLILSILLYKPLISFLNGITSLFYKKAVN